MSFFDELKRRKVFKVGAAYLVVAWLAVQAASIAFPTFEAPLWALRVFILVVLLGFPLALVMAWLFDNTPEGVKFDHSVTGSKRVFAAAALLVVLALAWYYRGQPAFRAGESAPPASVATTAAASASPAATPAVDPHSIAVLPFVDMSQARDQEYFADIPTVARKLNVATILEGSVRKAGSRVRITAQLVHVATDSHLWSQTYDRELTDVFKVQDEIAGAVVAALKVHLLPDQAMTNAHRSNNAEAYNQYLLGNEFYQRMNPENWRRAIAAYQQAIALDGDYAAAYAGLSFAEGRLADNQGDPACAQRSLAAVEKALALAPELVDGYVTRGTMRLAFSRDLAGAQADFDKALALNASDSAAQTASGRLLTTLGRLPEAIAATQKAIELDPLSGDSWAQLGRLFNASGQLPRARQALERSLEIAPTSEYARFHLGETALLEGKLQDALATFDQGGSYGRVGVAMAQFSLGHQDASDQALAEQIAKYSHGSAYQVAEIYAWRGEKDKAFEWLDRALAQRDGGLSFFKSDPLIASLRGDPRYAGMLRKLGLTP